jgi:acetyltransferase-like isoleucine patch superfamily enzyme
LEGEVSGRRPNKWLSVIAWLLPNCGVKRWALRLLGNDIGRDVVLGPTLGRNCGPFALAGGVVFGTLNIFKSLSSVEVGPKGFIGNYNQFTAAAEYQRYSPLVGRLLIGESGVVTNRHYVDCSGQVIVEPGAAVGGLKSIIQSHELDLIENKTEPGRVIVGRRAVTSTGCILLKDSALPERSVLAAGSVLRKAKKGETMPIAGLYGGVPARLIRQIEKSAFWDRTENFTPAALFDDEKFRGE